MDKWLGLLFIVLVIYNMIYDSALSFKQKEDSDFEISENRKKRTIADKIVVLLVSIMLLVLILFVALNHLVPRIFALLLITIPVILKYIVGSVKAADSIKFIVLDDKNNKEMSIAEKMQFDVFVSGLLLVYQFIPMEKFITVVENNIENMQVSEWVLSAYILLFAFFVLFITFVELIIPFRHLRKLFEFIARKLGNRSKRLSLYFWRTWDNPLLKARLTDKMIEKAIKCKVWLRILLDLGVIPVFLIDIVYNFAFLFYSFIVCSCLGAVIAFARMVGKGILRTLIFITEIPGYRVVRNAFRMSGIIALFVLVIINRTEALYSTEDTFLAIAEFLASSIIIPVIFEWIYSSRNSQNTEK